MHVQLKSIRHAPLQLLPFNGRRVVIAPAPLLSSGSGHSRHADCAGARPLEDGRRSVGMAAASVKHHPSRSVCCPGLSRGGFSQVQQAIRKYGNTLSDSK